MWGFYFGHACAVTMLCCDTNPQEGRIALPVVANSKVVWLWPQDLHDVLVELGLFLLRGNIGSF